MANSVQELVRASQESPDDGPGWPEGPAVSKPVSELLRDALAANLLVSEVSGHDIGQYIGALEDSGLHVTKLLGKGNDNVTLRLTGTYAGYDRPVLKIGNGPGVAENGSRPFDAPLLFQGEFPMRHPDFGDDTGRLYIQPFLDTDVSWEDFNAFRGWVEELGYTDIDLGYPDVGQVGYDLEGNVRLNDYNAVGGGPNAVPITTISHDYVPPPLVNGPDEHIW